MAAMTENKMMRLIRRVPWAGDKLAEKLSKQPQVAVLRLSGVIGRTGGIRRGGLTLEDLADPIERAFKTPHLSAVALLVNSPGGSPVQSALISKRIRALADEKKVPVYAFCEDVAASGGYWLACAGDEILADGASVIGSIGVVSAGFGFPALLEKIGVERRVHTAGDKKAILDPFQPENPDDIEHLKDLQRDIHDQFKQHVRDRRGDRLAADDATLFSGEFWTGNRAKELGLVDDIGDLRSVMRAKFGEKVRLRVVDGRKGWIERKFGLQAAWVDDLVGALEARVLWGRYGL
jgi:signal peptide peptidase SppA